MDSFIMCSCGNKDIEVILIKTLKDKGNIEDEESWEVKTNPYIVEIVCDKCMTTSTYKFK